MSKKIKINNLQDFKNLNQREIMKFKKSDNDDFGEYFFKENSNVKEIIKGLRYVHGGFDKLDLRKPLSKYQKEKARKIFNQYSSISKRQNVQVIIPRKRNKKIIAELTQQTTKWKKFYLPNEGTNKANISYTKLGGKRVAKLKTNVAEYIMIYFDMVKLAENSEKEVERQLKKFKPKTKKKFKKNFKIIAGDHLINEPFADIQQINRDIKMLMLKYNGQDGMSDYQEWLFGVKAIYAFHGGEWSYKFNDKTKNKKKWEVYQGKRYVKRYLKEEQAKEFVDLQNTK